MKTTSSNFKHKNGFKRSKLYSLFGNLETAGLENLNFSFADSLIDSTCQLSNIRDTSPVMDASPRMYEEGSPDVKNKIVNSVFTFKEESQGDNSLDPALETVVDIQELLNATLEAEGGPLNIDNIFPAGDLELAEGHTSTGNYLDISKVIILNC